MKAQQYTSLSGLIHLPSADIAPIGEGRIGAHFLNKHFLPKTQNEQTGMGNYPTVDMYLGITPFPWLELGYTMTLMKGSKGSGSKPNDLAYNHKDRYFSIKVRPLKEANWWPSIALGTNDPVTTIKKETSNQYFANYFIAATKHIYLKNHILGVHVAYRYWKRDFNERWNGIVGGVTYQPSFQKDLRFIAEYTGDDINIGFDWKLWKHILIQASLQDLKYFSGGLCFCLNLL